ncbi:TetR/AcrR family transcriptional regulator [Pelagibacterium lentulum]|uniref:TetR family transcriptional regulator n=1 Tax=Pelagibacterium lentulum TaxID=2029865 RepID=A0A916R458_9HYPH|nr:TetR/AcrR family transcriptional regulator [Pelagibacterium lentulum]GGA36270.1 TetR family transcriptional regulator [Pelagibacterium lentulum]
MARAAPAQAVPPRTRRRDADATKSDILAAGRAEFADKGFGGARIDAIATRANVNKRMLYHYFGDKDALYRAVLTEAYREIRAGEKALSLDCSEPVEAVERLVRFTFRHFLENPWFIALLTNENLMRARYIKSMPEISGLHSPLVDQLRTLIERGAEKGLFRRDIDPVQLYISIAALGYFYVSNCATLSVIFQTDLRARDRIATREDHCVQMVLDHLLTRPAPKEPTAKLS